MEGTSHAVIKAVDKSNVFIIRENLKVGFIIMIFRTKVAYNDSFGFEGVHFIS